MSQNKESVSNWPRQKSNIYFFSIFSLCCNHQTIYLLSSLFVLCLENLPGYDFPGKTRCPKLQAAGAFHWMTGGRIFCLRGSDRDTFKCKFLLYIIDCYCTLCWFLPSSSAVSCLRTLQFSCTCGTLRRSMKKPFRSLTQPHYRTFNTATNSQRVIKSVF